MSQPTYPPSLQTRNCFCDWHAHWPRTENRESLDASLASFTPIQPGSQSADPDSGKLPPPLLLLWSPHQSLILAPGERKDATVSGFLLPFLTFFNIIPIWEYGILHHKAPPVMDLVHWVITAQAQDRVLWRPCQNAWSCLQHTPPPSPTGKVFYPQWTDVHVSVSSQMLRSLPGLAGSRAAAPACPRSFSTTQARQHLPSDIRHGVPPHTHPLEASTSIPTILFYNSAYCLRVSLPAVSFLRLKTLDYPLLHL